MTCPIFLIEGEVEYTPYMGRSKTTKVLRIVAAATIGHAERKFVEHYALKSRENDDSYSARVIESSAVIS